MSRHRLLTPIMAAAAGALLLSTYSTVHADGASEGLPASMAKVAKRQLSLQDALSLAIQNNLGIQIQSEQVAIGRASVRASEGSFEPTVSARVNHNDSVAPPASSVDGMLGEVFKAQSQLWTASINQRLSTGTNLGLNLSSSRNKNNSGSAVEPLFYGTKLDLSISQPLLRGFSLDRDIPRASILKARFASKHDMEAKRIVMANQVLATENAYWNLAEAARSYGVQEASLALAEDQLALTEKQIAAGILAPADRISSESSVARRELALVQSEARLAGAMDLLRLALNLPKGEWNDTLIAVDMPQIQRQNLSLDDAMKLALVRRPEIRQNQLAERSADIDKRIADNNRLPELDVGISYGLAGQSDAYSGSLDQLQGLGVRDWGVFANLSWSPMGKVARANADSLQASSRIRRLRHEQFLIELRSEIRAALRTLETAERQVAASERFRDLANRSLEAERKRFLNGKSRNLEVSRREEELSQARTAEISARIAFLKAKSALDLATGSLLESKSIVLEEQ
ncbi:MAG: TolC family protein [Myxococcales bacterium]|nr:TolC family protein [Myxococcales bacterium]